MPRIHEGGNYRRKQHRGIFSLTTPFQPSNGDLSFRDDEDDARRTLARNAVVVGGVRDDRSVDIEVQENEGGMMSQLTWEGGTQYYNGARDGDAPETGDDLVVDEPMAGDENGKNAAVQKVAMTSRRDSMIQASSERQEMTREMNDGFVEDDSVTTMDDHHDETLNDEASIDLLQDECDNDANIQATDDVSSTSNPDDLAKASILFTNATPMKNTASVIQRQHQLSKQNIVSVLSPATLTLDRLDAFGSQEGGAELSIHLLAKVAETHAERNVEIENDHTTDNKATLVETIQKSQGGEKEGHELKKSMGESSSNGENPKNIRKPLSQFVPRPTPPSKQGSNVDKEDTLFLTVGTNGSKTKYVHNNVSERDDDSDTSISHKRTAEFTNNSKSSDKVDSPESYTKEIQSVSASLVKRKCLHELKEYFMSTQNSSEYARTKHGRKDHPSPPLVPFCLQCNNSAMRLPHHGLCPKHVDFFNSGSYEILNLIVDGNRIGCEACEFHFENGRPNKHLEHIAGCERRNKKGGQKKNRPNDVSASRAVIGGENSQHSSLLTKDGRRLFTATLKDAAAAGCSKCQRELATGEKTSKKHDDFCPRKGKPKGKNISTDSTRFNRANRGENSQRSPILDDSSIRFLGISLEDAAAAGCGKCQRELKTGIKTASTHDESCPRKGRGDQSRGRDKTNTDFAKDQTPSLDAGASSGCRKCQIELATGIKDQKRHDINCPLGRQGSSYNNEKSPNQSTQKNQAATKTFDNQQALPHSDDDMNACVVLTRETSSSANGAKKKYRETTKFDVGTFVFVETRTWAGINKPGGVARVTKVHLPTRNDLRDSDEDNENNCTKYDVAYILETRREKMVDEHFISLYTDYASPSKEKSGSLPDDEVDIAESERVDRRNQRRIESPTFDFTPAGKEKNGHDNAEASISDDAEEICISSAEKLHKDGNPLSDYELLRLRNIKRNEARLVKLGLLVPAKKKAKTSDKRKSRPSNDGQKEDIISDGKKPVVDAEKMSMPHRQAKENNHQTLKRSSGSNDDIEKPKKKKKPESEKQDCTKSSLSKPPSKDSLQKAPQVDSLVLAAKSGCRKCTLEWQSERIDPSSYHDQCCPRRSASHTEDKTSRLQSRAPDKTITERTTPPDIRGNTMKSTPGNTSAIRSVTPSPALFASRASQSLPAFIAEFTAQASIHDDVPAPRGSKWLPCPNPWGKIGHEEGDVVIISPFQSENAHDLISTFHQSPQGYQPKRFAFSPFEQNSPYHVTHRSPARGGYSVLRLTRDRVALIPWGFTVRNHEFGGACLVDSVEPLSPAESAEDISGWKDSQSSPGSSLGLKIHDMIIGINGKTVGGMTEAELQIELDLCGPQLMLVVCRFDIVDQLNEIGSHGENDHGDLAMDWNDIGAVASTVQKSVSFGECNKQTNSCAINKEDFLVTTGETANILTSNQCTVSKRKIGDLDCNTDQSNDSSRVAVEVYGKDQKTRPLTMHNSEKNKITKKMEQRKEGHDNANSSITSSHRKGSTSRKDNTVIANKKSYDKKISNTRVGESHAVSRYRKQIEELSDESQSEHEKSFGTMQNNASSNNMEKDACRNAHNKSHEDDSRAEDSEEDDDENPWLGCVCGKTHPHPIKVFWLQCETCDAWYNVAEDCVGFDANIAESLDEWSCWTCCPPIAGLE